MNNVAERMIDTGKVSTHAITIFVIVFACKFLTPLLATIAPAIPEESVCVVLTGSFHTEAIPIVAAATNSAEAPCA